VLLVGSGSDPRKIFRSKGIHSINLDREAYKEHSDSDNSSSTRESSYSIIFQLEDEDDPDEKVSLYSGTLNGQVRLGRAH
jgi:hypothetical protein